MPPHLGRNTMLVLKRGDRSEAVKRVQIALIQRGFDVGDSGADGVFGRATERAVLAFQTKVNLKDKDGIVGKDTLTALGLDINTAEPTGQQSAGGANTLASIQTPDLVWPDVWDRDPNFLTVTFIDGINARRPLEPLLISSVGSSKIREQTLEDSIPLFVAALNSESGIGDIAETMLSVNLIIAAQVAVLVRDFLSDRLAPDPITKFPTAARDVARQLGTLRAWVDVAIKTDTNDKLRALDLNRQEWESMATFTGLFLGIIPFPGGVVGSFAGAALGQLVTGSRPDFEGQVEDLKQVRRAIRDSHRQLSSGIFGEVLDQVRFDQGPSLSLGIDPVVGLYGDWILGGWDDELDLLGFSIAKTEL
jgi:hypothetical protein